MSEETNIVSTPVNTEATSAVEGVIAENEIKDAIAEKAADESNAPVAEEPQRDEFSSKFAALSRKEKELRQRQQEFEAQQLEYEAWKTQQEEAASKKEPELPLEYKLRKDPIGTLQELGMSYDKLTELVLNDGKLPADMQMDLMRRDLQSEYDKKLQSLQVLPGIRCENLQAQHLCSLQLCLLRGYDCILHAVYYGFSRNLCL